MLTASGLAGNMAQPILQVGQYQLSATATSTGGTSTPPAVQNFTVNYDIQPSGPDLTSTTFSKHGCTSANGKPFHVIFQALAWQPPDTAIAISGTEWFIADQTVSAEFLDSAANSALGPVSYTTNPTTGFAITGSTGPVTATDKYQWLAPACQLNNGTYTINIYFKDYYGIPYLQRQQSVTITD